MFKCYFRMTKINEYNVQTMLFWGKSNHKVFQFKGL